MNTATILWRNLLRPIRFLPLLALLPALPLSAEVPSLINYQGRLTNAQGNPVTGNRTMAVRIYDAATGGNLTYQETIGTVAVSNGTYSFRFGSGGSVSVNASETIATTNGIHQIFNGALQGTPTGGTVSLTDGTFSWSSSSGSSNPSAFGVTYNGTARSFQVIYFTQVPAAGRAIVANYQTTEVETIDASLAGGAAYLALSVNGTEETARTRLLAVPYALKAKESEDTQAIVSSVEELSQTLSELETRANRLEQFSQSWSENLGLDFEDPDAVQEFANTLIDIQKNQRVLKFYTYVDDEEFNGYREVSSLNVEALVGGNEETGLIIWNKGFRPVKIEDIILPEGFEITSANISDESEWVKGEEIRPDQVLYLNIAFSPTEGRTYSGELEVMADVTSGVTSLPISGLGLVNTPVLAFVDQWGYENRYNLAVNGSVRSFSIKNIGNGNLQISGVNFSDSRLVANFSGSVTLAPGQTHQIPFIYTGNSSWVSGNITFASNLSSARNLFPFYGSLASLSSNMVNVEGGTLPQSSELSGTEVSTFQIGKYEVTWDEWQEVRAWAVANGYSDLANVGAGSAGNHPVHSVSWYDVVKWMNARSEKEGLTPVYEVNGQVYRSGETVPFVNSGANGYRLPTEAEWEWAARGGISSQGYIYSGSNNVNAVAWYDGNSSGAVVNLWQGRGTWPVGQKVANELGIHDMSGNVREWCWDETFSPYRRFRGGGCLSYEVGCTTAFRDYWGGGPDARDHSVGFRLARSSGQ